MGRIFFLLLFGLLPIGAGAQVVAIMNSLNGHQLYLCIENRLTVAVEGLESNEIIVTTDNGSIKEDTIEGPGHYLMRADKIGRATVFVSKKTGAGKTKLISSISFNIKRLPLAKPIFKKAIDGKITQNEACVQIGLASYVTCCDIEAPYPVLGFTTTVVRNGQEIFKRETRGKMLDSFTRDFFYQLKDYDQLMFTDVTVKDCDGAILTLEPINLTVTDTHEYENVMGENMEIIDPVTGEAKIKKGVVTKRRKEGK